MLDLLTSPPSSTAPSPSVISLAAFPSLAPSIVNPWLSHTPNTPFSATFRRTSFVPPTDDPLSLASSDELVPCIPSMDRVPQAHTLGRASHSNIVLDSVRAGVEARLPRPSLPAIVPILNVTIGQDPNRPNQLRKPSFQIDLPSPTDCSAAPPPVPAKTVRPALAVQQRHDENAARRSSRSSSYVRTPYPDEEGLDYMEHLAVSMRRAHPCDMPDNRGEIRWTDPWARTSEVGEEGDGAESDESSLLGPRDHADDEGFGGFQGSEAVRKAEATTTERTDEPFHKERTLASSTSKVRVGSKDKVEVMDVSHWASVGMEQAWSADSQSAVEGDSLLVGA